MEYLSLDSTLVRAYGFIDVDFDIESSSMKHTRGSFYLFIPEIELDELEGISNLAATLVWDDSSLCTFEEAVQSYELALYQATHQFWPTTEKCHNKCISSALRKFNVMEDKNTYMLPYFYDIDLGNDTMEVVSPLTWESNDIQFWNKNKSMEGLSAKSVIRFFYHNLTPEQLTRVHEYNFDHPVCNSQ
ncbi:unnamed protein product [Camellia sinensis]